MKDYIHRATEIYREYGVLELLQRGISHLESSLNRWFISKYYYSIYPEKIMPKPHEILYFDPSQIDYSISSSDIPNHAPEFGILDGHWDNNKIYWRDTWAEGLVERFKYGKEWYKTEYYLSGMRRLRSGGELGRLDGKQTIKNFHTYLKKLDELYYDIFTHGYNISSTIVASIGRYGELIVHNGNHRRAIARIAGVDSVPVQIKYRHKLWQLKREYIYNLVNNDQNVDQKAVSKFGIESLKHPDIQNIIKLNE